MKAGTNGESFRPDLQLKERNFKLLEIVNHESFKMQALAVEKAVLGSILKDPSVIPSIGRTLHSEYFKDPSNATIWQILLDLELEGVPIDLLSVHGKAENIKPVYLVHLTESAPVAQNLSFYAKKLIDNHIAFQAQSIMRVGLSLGHNVQPNQIIEQLQSLEEVRASEEDNAVHWDEAYRSMVEKLKSGNPQGEGYLKQVSYPKLDEVAPLHKGELCIVGAIESGGKTAFAVNLCVGLAKQGHKGIYLFYESNPESLSHRIASISTRIPLNRIKRGQLSETELKRVEEEGNLFGKELLYKDKSQKGAIHDLVGYVRSRVKKEPCDYIVIDHMHQMPIAGKIREGFIDISRRLLSLAKQENICVIALAQFRKPNEKEYDKRPNRTMIRESSSIAQDAHHIWFLHDPKYLAEKREEQKSAIERMRDTNGGQDDSSGQKHAEIIVDKNREGMTTVIPAEFRRECVLWREI